MGEVGLRTRGSRWAEGLGTTTLLSFRSSPHLLVFQLSPRLLVERSGETAQQRPPLQPLIRLLQRLATAPRATGHPAPSTPSTWPSLPSPPVLPLVATPNLLSPSPGQCGMPPSAVTDRPLFSETPQSPAWFFPVLLRSVEPAPDPAFPPRDSSAVAMSSVACPLLFALSSPVPTNRSWPWFRPSIPFSPSRPDGYPALPGLPCLRNN